MHIGVIGLGRMGGNIVRRLMDNGHQCTVYDVSEKAVATLAGEGATPAGSIEEMVEGLAAPRAVWVMLPEGKITADAVEALGAAMSADDVIIDGGNSFYKDDISRGAALKEKGIHYVDVGTSGGVWGRERGYCLMIGGDKDAVDRLDPVFKTLAPGRGDIPLTKNRESRDPRVLEGYMHCGPTGSGHFVKMVHNGIEYGLMQAYAEGFDVLKTKASPNLPEDRRFDLDVADIAEVWRRGSVVSSWLLDLTASALAGDEELSEFEGRVADSGEGRWTIEAAIEEAVPVDVLATALFARFRSRQDHTFADRLLSAMRFQFGGHAEAPGGEKQKVKT
ncbi:phosphogluconate dehydrogenase (NAD(+)-dependent, decarboxylating) [Chenggangzhangella methanolivorans]|uniref:Decarboxylating 6-phosphogluconate dehydrogenase n=1 Tax=Chenggangzhangella methanolivorans TaxID=1437009 RepID=A0A9E6R9S4_9HYPH|nr:decarboxylating 6-phosphogluconate dehydrogenase [Chenggangzhangella methanolivorans]QZN99924.1 decarboxylating 6-phosphogluconate dehydrogenase [Chenggangzhangella methanolivorans]